MQGREALEEEAEECGTDASKPVVPKVGVHISRGGQDDPLQQERERR